MNVTGLVYSVSQLPALSAGAGSFRIIAMYVQSDGTGEALVRFPADWIFPLPTADGLAVQRSGVSETKGLLGGVANETLMRQSEAVERAIGDVLTLMLCEVLDRATTPSDMRVLILGPALPKVVGRFASLRLPRSLQVIWVSPRSFPTWIVEGINESAIFPGYQPAAPTTEAWEEEPMVRGWDFFPAGASTSCVVQQLQLGDTNIFAGVKKFDWKPLDLKDCAADIQLPRELVAATGQLQNHLSQPYTAGHDLRMVDKHDALYSIPKVATSPKTREDLLFGWRLSWL